MDRRIKEPSWKYVEIFDDKQKVIDYAVWMNFKYRLARIVSGVFQDSEGSWCVCEEATREELGVSFTEVLPESYVDITFEHIQKIASDQDSLKQWEVIKGMVSVMDGEILRFIIHAKIPLVKFIRHELALRGFDKDHRWCGFDKAKKIWLEKE